MASPKDVAVLREREDRQGRSARAGSGPSTRVWGVGRQNGIRVHAARTADAEITPRSVRTEPDRVRAAWTSRGGYDLDSCPVRSAPNSQVLCRTSSTVAIMVALWPDSNSTANLSRSREATLVAVVAPESYYIRLRAGRPSRIKAGTSEPVMFTCHVEEALSDVVPYAEVTAGIQFRLADGHEAPTLDRWYAIIKAMRALGGDSGDHAPTAIT